MRGNDLVMEGFELRVALLTAGGTGRQQRVEHGVCCEIECMRGGRGSSGRAK